MTVSPLPRLRAGIGLLCLTATLAFAATARAEVPDGAYFFDPGDLAPLLVIEGDADLSNLFLFSFLCEDFKTRVTGKLKGNCDVRIPISGDEDLKGKLKGRIAQDGDTTRLIQKLALKASVRVQGRRYDIRVQYNVKASFTSGDDFIKYSLKGKSCVEGDCSKTPKTSYDIPAIAFQDIGVVTRGWTLTLDVATDSDDKVKGTATVLTEDGKTLDYKVKGRCEEGVANLKLKPEGKKAKGTALKLKNATVDAGVMSGTLVFDLFGNGNSIPVTSSDPPAE
jgi:hypothetical protein